MPKDFIISILVPSFNQEGLFKEHLKHKWEFNIYSLSCFCYTLAGIIRIKQDNFNDGINLILQSFISYMSDVHTLGTNSKWHLIDRYSAIIVSIYHFYSLNSKSSIIINLLLFLVGFRYLKRSQIMYSLHDDNFLIEHTKWHFISILMAITSN